MKQSKIQEAAKHVLKLVRNAHGKSMQEMAAEKGISERTVDTHCGHLRAKFGVHSAVSLVVQAVLSRFLDL